LVHPLAIVLQNQFGLTDLERDITNLLLEDVLPLYEDKPQDSLVYDPSIEFATSVVHETIEFFQKWSTVNRDYYNAELDGDAKDIKRLSKRREELYQDFKDKSKARFSTEKEALKTYQRTRYFFDLYSLLWFYDEWFTLQQEQTSKSFKSFKSYWKKEIEYAQKRVVPAAHEFVPYFETLTRHFEANAFDVEELLKRWNAYVELSARTRRVQFVRANTPKLKMLAAAEQAAFCLRHKNNTDESLAENEEEEADELGSCAFDANATLSEDECLNVMHKIDPKVFVLAVGANRLANKKDAFESELDKPPSNKFLAEPIVTKYWDTADSNVPFDAIDIHEEQASPQVILALKRVFSELTRITLPEGAGASLIPLPLQAIKEEKERKKEKKALANLRKENGTLVQNDLDFADATDKIRKLAADRAQYCFKAFPRVSFVEAYQLFRYHTDKRVIAIYFQYLQDILDDTRREFKLDKGEDYTEKQLEDAEIYVTQVATSEQQRLQTLGSTARQRLKVEQYLERILNVYETKELTQVQELEETQRLVRELAMEAYAIGQRQRPVMIPKAENAGSQKYGVDLPWSWFQDVANKLKSKRLQTVLPVLWKQTNLNYYYPPWLQEAVQTYYTRIQEQQGKEDILQPLVLAFREHPTWIPLIPQLLKENVLGNKVAAKFMLPEEVLEAVELGAREALIDGLKKLGPAYQEQLAFEQQQQKERMKLGLLQENAAYIDKKALQVVGTDEAREMLGEQRTRKQLKKQAAKGRKKAREEETSQYAEVSAKLSKGKLYMSVLPPEPGKPAKRNLRKEMEKEDIQEAKRRSRERKKEEEEEEGLTMEKKAKQEHTNKFIAAVNKAEQPLMSQVKLLQERRRLERLQKEAERVKTLAVKRGGFVSSSSSSTSTSSSSSSSSKELQQQQNDRKHIRPKQGEGVLHYQERQRRKR